MREQLLQSLREIDPHQPQVPRNRLARFLYCRNPFYLLSVGCVLHAASLWVKSGGDHEPWILMGLIGGYILLLGLTAFSIVRFGRVWDDARSIFVLILVLFCELSLSFDDTLVLNAQAGTGLVLCGYALAVIVFEGLLLGLRIRLGTRYRLPFHLLLAMLFLYPLLLVEVAHSATDGRLQWRLFAFAPLVGLCVLSLVPAARRGASYVRGNGTPWAWPLFPWTPFVVLIAGLVVRAMGLCASFDPALSQTLSEAMQLETIFAGYFMVPLVLCLGVVLLELGLTSKNAALQAVVLLFPAAAVWLAIPGLHPSGPQLEFLETFTNVLAAPMFLTLCAVSAFYLYAALRGVSGCETAMTLAVGTLVVVGPETDGFGTLVEPQVWPLALLAAFHLLTGAWRRNAMQLLAGSLCLLPILNESLIQVLPPTQRAAVVVHAGATFVLLGALFTHHRLLQFLGATTLVALCGLAVLPESVTGAHVSPPARLLYSGVLSGLCLLIGFTWQLRTFRRAGICCGSLFLAGASWHAWSVIRTMQNWRSVLSYAAGIVLFVVALLISVAKARARSRPNGNAVPPVPFQR